MYMKTRVDYSYQNKTAKAVYYKAMSGNYIASVLAAAPSAGKTNILIKVLNILFEKYPEKKVRVFTHNQTVLRDQMLEDFTNGFETPNFTFGVFGSDSMVEVGTHGSYKKVDDMDIMVVDEAHEYFWQQISSTILKKHKPEAIILLTGSPSYFNKYNKHSSYNDRFGMTYISANELIEKGVYAPVDLDSVVCNGDIIDRYEKAISQLKNKKDNFTKIMIAVDSIKQGKVLANYISKSRKVSLSTSENDPNNEEIKKFKNNDTNTLIVIQKGILGFSDNYITSLIDLRMSQNIDVRNQLFSRLLRRHPENTRKTYISVPKDSKQYSREVGVFNRLVEIMDVDNFKTYEV